MTPCPWYCSGSYRLSNLICPFALPTVVGMSIHQRGSEVMNFRQLRFSTAPQRANDKRPASAPTVDFVHFIIGLPIRRDRVSSLFWSAPCFIAELTNRRTGDLPARRVGPPFPSYPPFTPTRKESASLPTVSRYSGNYVFPHISRLDNRLMYP